MSRKGPTGTDGPNASDADGVAVHNDAVVSPETNNRRTARKVIEPILGIYICIAMTLAAPYFNWQYAKENGFMQWIAFGEIVPTAKAAIWPYYLFVRSKSSDDDPTWAELYASLKATNAANEISHKIPSGDYTNADLDERNALLKEALKQAEKVNPKVLDGKVSGYGETFSTKYLVGLRLMVEGVDKDSDSDQDSVMAAKMMNEFLGWVRLHQPEIRKADQ